ncbi:N-hydroxyarylamine O-acetyltransferase [Actinoplanes octamycinicus]|uniref:N-hydroxyarylamine O-acetyltransferase n=1 Tax=Actinoplanes octamycinicus TaxID=135948 RepID=A0A7W7H578_9ACTN|nr:arylamine N-acetyltransferase [Actinoplanes octamycinicus]MBB4744235.1 N-hydroxyarylamine O-acetyltransferase [Actinoplanes octamycinicus]GIE56807.1 N-hydroxyarylamine O-acetyltransferase [Actinoplanes octamycinicus]
MDVIAYLDRIGVPRDATLPELTVAHQTAVPFENLSIHLGETISLDPDDLFDKIVRRRRGGFCYELNGLFALLLEELGHTVDRVACRVHRGDGRFGPLFDHLALIVDGEWLVDVGFGRHSSYPLRLNDRGDQTDPGGVFRLTDTDQGDVVVHRDGSPQYQLERRPRPLTDFEPTCWWQQTWPESHFRKNPVCTRLDGADRLTLSGRTLIRTVAGERAETVLESDEALLSAYKTHFGIELDRIPSL